MIQINEEEKAMRIMAGEKLFRKGYSCAQSVCGSFADDYYNCLPEKECRIALTIAKSQQSIKTLPLETLIKISSSFGAGFGRQRMLCGAVSGAGMILGLILCGIDPEDKGAQYETIKKFTQKFEMENETIICSELLKKVKSITAGTQPQQRTREYYKERPCQKFVTDAIDLVCELLKES